MVFSGTGFQPVVFSGTGFQPVVFSGTGFQPVGSCRHGQDARASFLRGETVTTRRDFLARGLRDSSLIALAPTLPGFLASTARAAAPGKDDRILVVVQLDGGNDGINTVVPFKDDGYAKYRKAIRLPEKRLIKINAETGLHPSMKEAGKLLESGRLAIVPGVGYPNPNRSHFRSREIWQSARLDERDHTGLGWVGRGLDGGPTTRDGAPAAMLIGPDSPPPAIRGRRSVSAALDRLDDYALSEKETRARQADSSTAEDDLGRFLRRSLLDAYTTADRLESVAGARDGHVPYPESELAPPAGTHGAADQGRAGHARLLPRAGRLRHARPSDRRHAPLLEDLCESLKAFLDDLAASRLADRVVVMVFSEFGRRVQENGSIGTDHGTAGPVLLAGPCVRPGLVGTYPSLMDLADGDLKMTVDFRRVYATILQTWLGLSAKEALGGTFEPLPLFHA